jgi:DNA-directed RNA polymerase subunit RPC12/RpoP
MEENKKAAQEVPVQEQYVGKCNQCNKDNEITLPKYINKLPTFCMYCGSKMGYSSSSQSPKVVGEPQ